MTVVIRDAEFTRDDVALLIASRRLGNEIGPHGIPWSEALDPANQFAFQGQKAPETDWAAKADLDARDAFYKAHKDANRNGHRWGKVTRRAAPGG